jgi:hypothetical protein
MQCRNHPDAAASDRCAGCMEPFCEQCLVTVRGRRYCSSCKVMAIGGGAAVPGVRAPAQVFERATEPCKEADEALKYAIIGLFCFGIILEPIAISKALKAKKMIAANPNLTGEGKANISIVIGIIGLLLWVVGIAARVKSV